MSHDPTSKYGSPIAVRPSTSGMAKGDISSFRLTKKKAKVQCLSKTAGDSNPIDDNNGLWMTNSLCPPGGGDECTSSDENNSPTALNSFDWDKPALNDKRVDFEGWSTTTTEQQKCSRVPAGAEDESHYKRPLSNGYVNLKSDSEEFCERGEGGRGRIVLDPGMRLPQKVDECMQRCAGQSFGVNPSNAFQDPHNSRNAPTEPMINRYRDCDTGIPTVSGQADPPSPQECWIETLAAKHEKEKEELKKFPWFKGDLPREATLEALSAEPVGSFIVRESSTKPGCYALTLRVPEEKNPSGVAHYLVLHTNRGYKIKGFTKDFSTLQALTIHHSVMPELLPCPLQLPKPNMDSEHSRRNDDDMDFVESERRCSVFSDIHWVMTDLKL